MRKIDENSYNEVLISKLNDLDRQLEQLSPEHINRFPVDLLKKLNEIDAVKYRYAAESSVNGVDGDKLNGMVSYLKTFSHEYQAVTRVVRSLEGVVGVEDALDAYGINELRIPAPYGFDGRNSFTYTYDSNGLFQGASVTRAESLSSCHAKFWPIPNKQEVVVQYGQFPPTTNIYITTLFWRLK
jgi:hypothetical protein